MEELFASEHGEGTLDIQGLGEIEDGTVGGTGLRRSSRADSASLLRKEAIVTLLVFLWGMCVSKNPSGTGFTPQSPCRPRRHLDLISHFFHLQNEVETQRMVLTCLPGSAGKEADLAWRRR